MNDQEKADALFEDQKSSWPLLGANLEKLGAAQIRRFTFEGFSVNVQYNPKRIVSTSAKVDKLSIENRNCFLCRENRPPEERNILFQTDYEILCNPFPIFTQHYTIAKVDHIPQVIESEFARFLDLSKALYNLVLFYNAPGSGASAPDHMHFQAGSRQFLPIENDMEFLKQMHGISLVRSSEISVTAIEDGLRRFMVLESNRKDVIADQFLHIITFLKELHRGEEPMINMLCYYRKGWQVLIFPRERHRPWQYFEQGDRNILLSPAAVDMGGVLITPLEKDFDKITRLDIEDIFSQVTMSAPQFAGLKKSLHTKLNSNG